MEPQPLAGRTVAVPETRELEVFAAMLERRGASVVRCPLVAIHDAPDPAPVLAFARGFAGGACDDLILSTGEGLRRILACIERHEPALKARFLAALASVRKITRGPKAARELRELGLKPDLPAQPPTTAGIISCLAGQDLRGRRVGVQLYGTEPNRPLVEFLERAGATVLTVATYVYADGADDAAVRGRARRGGQCGARAHAGGRGRSGRGRRAQPAWHQGAPHAGRVFFSEAADDCAGGGAARARVRILVPSGVEGAATGHGEER